VRSFILLVDPGDIRPPHLFHAVGHNAVLGLCGGVGDDRLLLGGLRDEVGVQEHDVTGSGTARVGTTNPVKVGVNHELRRRGGSE
jgi:hypothetical protein